MLMLFLHALVFFVLYTSAVAIPISPNATQPSSVDISRRGSTSIPQERLNGLWRKQDDPVNTVDKTCDMLHIVDGEARLISSVLHRKMKYLEDEKSIIGVWVRVDPQFVENYFWDSNDPKDLKTLKGTNDKDEVVDSNDSKDPKREGPNDPKPEGANDPNSEGPNLPKSDKMFYFSSARFTKDPDFKDDQIKIERGRLGLKTSFKDSSHPSHDWINVKLTFRKSSPHPLKKSDVKHRKDDSSSSNSNAASD